MTANVFTIPASAPFAETLARELIARTGAKDDPLALATATIYLPTRRAARSLNDAFAKLLSGAALLPEVRPLGDVDEDELLFDTSSEPLTLPPAISPLRRRLLLATMVRRWSDRHRDGAIKFAQASALASALGNFLDEAETVGLDLAKVDKLVTGSLAAHWADVREFLKLLRTEWPDLLKAERAMNFAERRNLALRGLAKRLDESPPSGLVVAAGSTGSIPATAELIAAIARLPNGLVVLPALDRELDTASWETLDPGHPQFGLKQLLDHLALSREQVRDLVPAAMPEREFLLRETLRPAPTTDAWRKIAEHGASPISGGLNGLSLIEAAHPGEEAAAIALALRHALEPAKDSPPQRAALVTPDRGLARRVVAELKRWNIDIDDSGGRKLSQTPPGVFLLLLAEAAVAQFAPVPLLSLLKHPLAAGGQAPADFRRRVRQLDRLCLRGPRPDPGIAGIRAAIDAALVEARKRERKYAIDRISELAYWFQPVTAMLSDLEIAFAEPEADLPALLDVHVAAAEALATSDDHSGPSRLWRGGDGQLVAEFAARLRKASDELLQIETRSYPHFLRALLEDETFRPPYGGHPQLAILGPLEARLQSFDLVILGGLNEGAWPAAPAADPWLSRPMRQQLGLDSPERRIGQAAHDFATLAAAPRVIFTHSLKTDGTPTVPSRWLQRLQQLIAGLGLADRIKPQTDYATFASIRDDPDVREEPMKRPQPRPPVPLRPRSLSVTEIETWVRDPYAIYAKHVLRLEPLDSLDAEIGPLERGSAIHAALEQFIEELSANPQTNEDRLIAIANDVFAAANLPKGTIALWLPRFIRAARWFVGEENKRRTAVRTSHLEIKGNTGFPGPAGEFKLRARADRIDELQDGSAAIIDYKTGSLPKPPQVRAMLAPQLPLEALILAAGGFEETPALTASELLYIRFGGGAEPGELRPLPDAPGLVAMAREKLLKRILDFDDETTAYLPRVAPYRTDIDGDYDHLSRVREWSLIGWEEPEE
ncbi:MAG TPA: double-strand break repair protein AddB [Rhizomicrobium sp.]|nr:double-strand break repair protein AddB [Rhizomicrobium sp.]